MRRGRGRACGPAGASNNARLPSSFACRGLIDATTMARTLTDEDLAAIAELIAELLPKKRKKPSEFATEADLLAAGVSERHAREWLAIRKAKGMPLSLTAWDEVLQQAQKAGKTPAEAIRTSCAQGWAGFRASWLARIAEEPAAEHKPAPKPELLTRPAPTEEEKQARAEAARRVRERLQPVLKVVGG